MTALTPQEMRDLAKNLDGVTPNPAVWVYEADWAHQAAGALRTAADQLEAVQDVDRIAAAIKASKDKRYGPSWDEFRNDPPTQADYGTARLIVAALTAGTAPQDVS